MKSTSKGLNLNIVFTKPIFKRKIVSALALMLILTLSIMPAEINVHSAPAIQAASTLTFTAAADAGVEERNPGTNAGTSNYLEVIQANNRSVESYLRFTVSGLTGVDPNCSFACLRDQREHQERARRLCHGEQLDGDGDHLEQSPGTYRERRR